MRSDAFLISLLYVEDDDATARILHKILSSAFSQLVIHTARSGEDGIKLYREHRHDIILSDIMMPGIDGIQMVREIKGLGPEPLCIFTTAKTGDSDFLFQAQELSRKHLYFKPTDCTDLIRGIRECIDTVIRQRTKRRVFSVKFLKAAADESIESVAAG